jgi:hypothetical protein
VTGLRAIAAIAVGVVLIGAILLTRRTSEVPSTSRPVGTSVEFSSSLHASQAPRSRVEDTAVPARKPAPAVPSARPDTATSAAIATDKPTKSLAYNLMRGPLPTSDNLRSSPTVHASPELQAAYDDRSSRASMLNRRLERHILVLRTKAKTANASEREALERDIAILESQLAARRPLESPAKPARWR